MITIKKDFCKNYHKKFNKKLKQIKSKLDLNKEIINLSNNL